jgi:hypothetical protein
LNGKYPSGAEAHKKNPHGSKTIPKGRYEDFLYQGNKDASRLVLTIIFLM